MHWNEIRGWLTPNEGNALRDLAFNRDVLELGNFCGRSTVCIGQVAQSLTTVDNHAAIDAIGRTETQTEFNENLKRFGLDTKVKAITGDIAEVCETLPDRSFDLVFVDSDHSAESAERDLRIALRVVRKGGVIAWHDCDMASVVLAVRAVGLEADCRADSLKWCVAPIDGVPLGHVKASEVPRVVIGMPYMREIEPDSLEALLTAGTEPNIPSELKVLVKRRPRARAGPTTAMNRLFAEAMDERDAGRATHFAMLHADIAPEGPWLNTLWGQMRKTGADIVSAVMAFKDGSGKTSTAIGDKHDPWRIRRFIYDDHRDALPETFGPEDVCGPDEVLLLNTGCMLIDLRRPWWDDFHFEFVDRITKDKGVRKVWHRPEDWNMSRYIQKHGAKVRATWAVKTNHIGPKAYRNYPEPEQLRPPLGTLDDLGTIQLKPVDVLESLRAKYAGVRESV